MAGDHVRLVGEGFVERVEQQVHGAGPADQLLEGIGERLRHDGFIGHRRRPVDARQHLTQVSGQRMGGLPPAAQRCVNRARPGQRRRVEIHTERLAPARQEVSASRPSSAVLPVPARPVNASSPIGCVSIQRTIRLSASRRPAKWRSMAVLLETELLGLDPRPAPRQRGRRVHRPVGLVVVRIVEEVVRQCPDLTAVRPLRGIVQTVVDGLRVHGAAEIRQRQIQRRRLERARLVVRHELRLRQRLLQPRHPAAGRNLRVRPRGADDGEALPTALPRPDHIGVPPKLHRMPHRLTQRVVALGGAGVDDQQGVRLVLGPQ